MTVSSCVDFSLLVRVTPELREEPMMANYVRGEPSTTLMVRNLADGVDEDDLRSIFAFVLPASLETRCGCLCQFRLLMLSTTIANAAMTWQLHRNRHFIKRARSDGGISGTSTDRSRCQRAARGCPRRLSTDSGVLARFCVRLYCNAHSCDCVWKHRAFRVMPSLNQILKQQLMPI